MLFLALDRHEAHGWARDRFADRLGIDRIKDKYAHICHLCWDIFKDDELAGALRNHFVEQQLGEMIQFLLQPPSPVASAGGKGLVAADVDGGEPRPLRPQQAALTE